MKNHIKCDVLERDPAEAGAIEMNPLPYDILTLRNGAVSAHASAMRPAWLFSADGSRLAFANATGAAMLGFATAKDAADAEVAADLAAQIARSAATLREGGSPRLERLRGLGTAFGRPLTCACSRVSLASGSAILVAAIEIAGPVMTLSDRARYLIDGSGAAAAFDAGGTLLWASTEAAQQIGRATSLRDLGNGIETLSVGAGADTVVLAFIPANSQPITSQAKPATAHADLHDLSPIAEAISAMTKEPPQQNGRDDATPPQPDGVTSNGDQTERRHPLRFVWETDTENRFTIASDDFIRLAGPRTTNLLGRFWGEISAKLALDPEGLVAHALVSRDTWSGIDVIWPTAAGDTVPVTLSGIPTFDRDRIFRGYRGLGVWNGDTTDDVEPVQPSTMVQAIETAAPAQADTEDEARTHRDDVRQPENVVPFRAANADPKPVVLNPSERSAFSDLGSRLAARLRGADELARGLMEKADREEDPPYVPPVPVTAPQVQAHILHQAVPDLLPEDDAFAVQRPVLDKLPLGILVYRGSNFLYANPAFLAFAGHASLSGFAEAGGLDSMFVEFDGAADASDGQRLRIRASDDAAAMDGRLLTTEIDGDNAMVLMLQPAAVAPQRAEAAATESAELAALLDAAVDGVVTVDRDGAILRANARAEKLFGYGAGALTGRAFADLIAPDSERTAMARLDRLVRGDIPADDDNREIVGRRRDGAHLSMQLMLGRADATGARFHALFRDLTRWKDAERDMTAARQQAEKASAAKSEFLAKISHEMRTPLNAIIGFSDVMMEERFGPVGNDRYRDYLKDINTSGAHVVSLLNDLLDLSKIEAGKMELSFERVDLNDITQQSVGIMQAQASRARVIVRTALSMNIPSIVADARSVRQIVLNLLSNSVKFTGAGGQVIVSTALGDRGDIMLRVRDTGAGMSEKDIETALQPFRQLTTSPRTDTNGTGLGLPLTKALVEANRARFTIKSAVNAGTLVEIMFPAGRAVGQ